jgi:hypothetical protein
VIEYLKGPHCAARYYWFVIHDWLRVAGRTLRHSSMNLSGVHLLNLFSKLALKSRLWTHHGLQISCFFLNLTPLFALFVFLLWCSSYEFQLKFPHSILICCLKISCYWTLWSVLYYWHIKIFLSHSCLHQMKSEMDITLSGLLTPSNPTHSRNKPNYFDCIDASLPIHRRRKNMSCWQAA